MTTIGSSQYTSSASYNLGTYTETSLASFKSYSLQLSLTCTVSGIDQITYLLTPYQGNSPPDWVTLDTSNGLLNFTTPIIKTQTTYIFGISSQVTGDASVGLKQISLTVLPIVTCKVNNCSICVSGSSSLCSSCTSGYIASSDSSSCISVSTTKTTEITTAQIFTASCIGVCIVASTALSAFSLSSFLNIWLVFNQTRVLILILLSEAEFPNTLYNYLIGFKLSLFNFSFISIQDIPGISDVVNWFDYPQTKGYLFDIGMTSESSLYNNINLICLSITIIIVHFIFRMLFKLVSTVCSALRFKRCRDFCDRIFKMFEFGFYIRIMLESLQFSLISTFSELKIFDDASISKRSSISFSIIYSFIYFLFCLIAVVIWIRKGKEKTLKHDDCWYGEIFKNTKNKCLSRGFTVYYILRTSFCVIFLSLSTNYRLFGFASSKILFLIVTQIVYTIFILLIRPLIKRDSNCILIVNELIFLILCCILVYFNEASRWNSAMENVFQYIIISNNMIVVLILTVSGAIKICSIISQIIPKVTHLQKECMNKKEKYTKSTVPINEEEKHRDFCINSKVEGSSVSLNL